MKWPTDEFPDSPIPQPTEAQWAEVLRMIHLSCSSTPSQGKLSISPIPASTSVSTRPDSPKKWFWLILPTALLGALLGWALRPETVVLPEAIEPAPQLNFLEMTQRKVEDTLAFEKIEIAKAEEIEIHSVSGNILFYVGHHPAGNEPVKAAQPGEVEFHHEQSSSHGRTYVVSEPGHPPMIWSKPNR
ncbi:MAG: hypothetical protein N2112_10120 [Gemmataceae bacterium]|jgi:hypothetical protein|nr:hypothetical protein [Gemmataceae bacterium]